MDQRLTLTWPALHPSQARVVAEPARFSVLACGRRWGKSLLGQDRTIEMAITGRPVGWFSPTYRMLADAWRDIREILQPVTESARADEHTLELINGAVVDMWSLDNYDAARGRRYARIVVDEAAITPNLQIAWEHVIRPTLTDYCGDAFFMSTPRGRGYFWHLWQLGQDQTQSEWRSWQLPTSANPFLDAGEIEAARRQLPERVFAQEYLAQFIEDSGLVFRNVFQAQTATVRDGRQDGHTYTMGLDWGKLADFTVISVVDMANGEQVYLDRFNQISYEVQVERVKVAVERFHPAVILAESNSIGEPLADRLRHDGVRVQSFTTTAHSKAELIENLSLALERGAVKILPDVVQAGELLAFEAERLPSGMVRYGAPGGQHDDTVMALALAWQATGRNAPAPTPGHDPFAVAARSGPAIELKRGRFERVKKATHTQWGFS